MGNTRLAGLLALFLGLALALLTGRYPAEAAQDRFAAPGGTGVSCTRSAPCTIQVALSLSVAGDKVYAKYGTYTALGTEVINVARSVELYGGWDGNTFGPILRNPAATPSVLDGEGLRRVVRISGNITPTLDGFTITGGNATGLIAGCDENKPDGCGGGIFINGAHPIIANNILTDNVAAVVTAGYPTGTTGYGGGIYAADAARTVIAGNTIISNAGSLANCGNGGGIYLKRQGSMAGAEVAVNRIYNNVASTTNLSCAWGGGIAGGPEGVLIEDNVVEGNRANGYGGGQGAGLYQWYGSALYRRNLVTRNRGSATGHAIYVGYSTSRLEANRVVDNDTATGVFFAQGSGGGPTLVNNVIARSRDWEVQLEASVGQPLTVTLLNNTVVGAGSGSGLLVKTGYVSLQLTNTILVSHTWAISNTVPASSTILASHTLFWANTYNGPAGDSPVPGDPAFAADGYHIRPASAALDSGAPVPLFADIDGDLRPSGPGWDIGADEAQLNRVYLPLVVRGGG